MAFVILKELIIFFLKTILERLKDLIPMKRFKMILQTKFFKQNVAIAAYAAVIQLSSKPLNLSTSQPLNI